MGSMHQTIPIHSIVIKQSKDDGDARNYSDHGQENTKEVQKVSANRIKDKLRVLTDETESGIIKDGCQHGLLT